MGKKSTQPLSNYCKRINEAAGELALQDPSLLVRRGDLLELARTKVNRDGYSFVKGKSRSKRFASPPDETPKPTRPKVSAQVRQTRISSLKEDIASIDQQLYFKEKRRQQAESIRNYKLCDEITEELQIVMKRKREMSAELWKLQEKDQKAKWYQTLLLPLHQMIAIFLCHHLDHLELLHMRLEVRRVSPI